MIVDELTPDDPTGDERTFAEPVLDLAADEQAFDVQDLDGLASTELLWIQLAENGDVEDVELEDGDVGKYDVEVVDV